MKTSHKVITNSVLAAALALVLARPSLAAETGQLQWSFQTGGAVQSSPALGADGTLYVGSDDGRVYALDGATGALKWRFLTGGAVRSSPAIGADATVYVGSLDRNVYALNGATGAKKWAFLTENYVSSSPAIDAAGSVYVGSADGWVYSLNGATGALKWTFGTSGQVSSSPAIGADGTVYVGSDKFYALSGATGAKRWVFDADGFFGPSPAIGSDGTVYAVSFDVSWDQKEYFFKVHALNGATGARRWRFDTGGGAMASPVIGTDGTVYVGTTSGTVFDFGAKLLALDGATGAKQWSLATLGWVTSTPALASDDTLYVGLDRGVSALDAATGATKWRFDIGSDLESSPAIGAEGTVYVGANDGKIYALKGTAGLASSPWPKFRHDARNTGRVGFVDWVFRQPSRVALQEGQEGRLAVALDVKPKPSFRWFRYNWPIPGATQAILTIPSVTRADEGVYTVVASNSVGQATSDPIRVVVSNVDPQSFVGFKWEGGNAGPVSLEATAQLGALAAWHSISNYPSSSATQLYVELDPGDSARFYRLNAPATLEFSTAGWLNGWWLTEPAGSRVRIEMVSAATEWSTWRELTTLTLPASPHLFLDLESLGAPERVYRTTVVP